MKVSEEFPSKYLKAADLNGAQPTLQIAEVVKEEVGQDKQKKMVLYFQDRKKGLVLNKTNSAALAAKFGDDTTDWVGKNAQLFTELVHFQGRTTDGLRVRPMVTLKQELSDEIPF
jgi:hypothetical protein